MTEGQQTEAWLQRWDEGCIGFHQDSVNPLLLKHWASIVPSADCRVLVPLCGKSRDMLWLAQRAYSVVGVELSQLACRAFFEEQGVPFVQESRGAFVGRGAGAGERWELEDQGSTDGTVVDDLRLIPGVPMAIESKQEVRFGRVQLHAHSPSDFFDALMAAGGV